jgi:hypothetical protein
MSFNNAPLRLAVYVGLAVTVLAFAYVAFLIAAVVFQGITVPGYVTLVAAILGIGGIQLLFLGVIGEYVGRIYFETKQRPHFIVADISDTEPGVQAPRRTRAPVREALLFDNYAAPGEDSMENGHVPGGRPPLRSDPRPGRT